MPLTDRQSEILKAIIEEHMTSAQPVASVELVEKRGLRCSGATVRNIMSDLVQKGYLQMFHVSSGRTPTDLAYRYYISELMQEDEVSVLEEIALKQKVWSQRYELEKLLVNLTDVLSDTMGSLAVTLTSDGFISYTGTSKMLDIPEFFEIDVTKSVFRFVDDYELAKSILCKDYNSGEISVLIGREIGLANMEPVCMVSTHASLGGKECYIGVIGPSRTRYQRVIPIMRYVSNLLKEISAEV